LNLRASVSDGICAIISDPPQVSLPASCTSPQLMGKTPSLSYRVNITRHHPAELAKAAKNNFFRMLLQIQFLFSSGSTIDVFLLDVNLMVYGATSCSTSWSHYKVLPPVQCPIPGSRDFRWTSLTLMARRFTAQICMVRFSLRTSRCISGHQPTDLGLQTPVSSLQHSQATLSF
jgi:hypothetical protein